MTLKGRSSGALLKPALKGRVLDLENSHAASRLLLFQFEILTAIEQRVAYAGPNLIK